METIKKLLDWLKLITPLWLRAVLLLLTSAILFIITLSCGTTRAVVHTRDSGKATITITTNNPIDVSTTPNLEIQIPTTHESTL